MSQEFNKNNPEEVDLIRLMNYFKNGVKSFFRALWRIVELFIEFILLLKKYWIIVVGLVLLGAIYGKFILPAMKSKDVQSYEMIVRTNPIANYELYSYAVEVNTNATNKEALREIGLPQTTKISEISVLPIKKLKDEVESYFQKIEGSVVRGVETDTLYFQKYDIGSSSSFLEATDYPLQRIIVTMEGGKPRDIQNKLISYFNNIPAIKNEQESKYKSLEMLEGEIQVSLNAIDSMLFNRAKAAKTESTATSEQVLVNTASRGNVEPELLYQFDRLTKRLYGVQQAKQDAESGVMVVSNLRIATKDKFLESNGLLKYSLFGFILASLIVLGIQFNKYLEAYPQRRKTPNA